MSPALDQAFCERSTCPARARSIPSKCTLNHASRKCAVASVLVVALATSTFAAGAKYYVERDTVGNCSVVDSKPSANSGMKILGDKGGYASKEDAIKALNGLPKDKCKGVVK